MYKVSYTSNGAQTVFAFSFPFFQRADIRVALDDQLQDTSKYSVFANADYSGGSVELQSAPESGVRIDIFRQISLSRVIDYQPTAKIDPEDLNSDFNFLLEAFRDVYSINLDIAQWTNQYDNVMTKMQYTLDLIQDKLSGGAVLGLYNNLLNVLQSALPELINDYGSIIEPAPNENSDDYGVL